MLQSLNSLCCSFRKIKEAIEVKMMQDKKRLLITDTSVLIFWNTETFSIGLIFHNKAVLDIQYKKLYIRVASGVANTAWNLKS